MPPSSLVAASRAALVARLLTVTRALGTTPPLASVTVPVIVPGRQQGDREIAVVIGRRFASGIGRYAAHRHPRFGDDTPAGIGHGAGEGTRGIVCQKRKDERTPQQRHA